MDAEKIMKLKINIVVAGAPSLVMLAMLLGLTGCSSKQEAAVFDKEAAIAELKTNLSSHLNDPELVQFRNVKFYPETLQNNLIKSFPQQIAICGEVNRDNHRNSSEFTPFLSMDVLVVSDGVVKLEHKSSHLGMIKPNGGQTARFDEVSADVCQNAAKPPRKLDMAMNATLSESELDSCFIAGESAATVYISDMAKYASGGLMPSTVMEKGCERKGNETSDPKTCIEKCELGFRKVAKDVLNGR